MHTLRWTVTHQLPRSLSNFLLIYYILHSMYVLYDRTKEELLLVHHDADHLVIRTRRDDVSSINQPSVNLPILAQRAPILSM